MTTFSDDEASDTEWLERFCNLFIVISVAPAPCPTHRGDDVMAAKSKLRQLVAEWRYGYLHGYSHGWNDHRAGRQYGERRGAELLRRARRMNDEAPLTKCATCGSSDLFFDPADGWSCNGCHRTDADE